MIMSTSAIKIGKSIEKSLRPMQRSIVAGSSSFAELGINLENLSALKTEDQFYVLSQSISSIDNPAQRAAMAMEVFGKSGTELLLLFAAGADGMQKMDTMADELVLTMNQSAVTAFLPDDKKE